MGLIVLCGKTASGKTFVRDKLVKMGYKSIVTYTTRPKRKNEREGITYHFVSDDVFKRMISANEFAEYKTYTVASGDVWYYGCTKTSISSIKEDEKAVIILTPQGYKDVAECLPEKTSVIYLYANRATISNRLKKRNDVNDDIQRRINSDEIDFKGFQNESGVKIVYNNENEDVNIILNKIINIQEKSND